MKFINPKVDYAFKKSLVLSKAKIFNQFSNAIIYNGEKLLRI
jgi:hypothetical protein